MIFLGQGGRVASHSNGVNKIGAFRMNIFKSITWHWEPGKQVSSFGCLSTIQVI